VSSLEAAPVKEERAADILSDDALEFLSELHTRFNPRRLELLQARKERGAPSGFLEETKEIREGDWSVVEPRPDYADRRVEITGPTDRKLVINALNSGAKGFMADFEDANSPTWANQVEGHVNLIDAIEGTITYDASEGKHYELDDEVATLLVRPRGWHLPEKHLKVDGETVAGAFMDFGLYVFHNAQRLLDKGKAPYFYLPKMEHHLEARLWNDVFVWAQDALGVPQGSIRATVLIETLPAAFQMDEILYELRDHSYGLNAGRWDYIFSMIKCFRDRPEFVLPDRTDVKMTVPFMHAYTELLVQTCHKRGAFAMGGMAAQIPSRKDEAANEEALAAAKADKEREAKAGFDGTWVAHPDVVSTAMAAFDAVLGDQPNQIDKQRPDVNVTPEQLLDAESTPGEITEQGLRNDISVGFQYISFWLGGRGAAGINNLMEDAATAEISRSQIWQWVKHGKFTKDQVRQILDEEMAKIREEVGEETWQKGRPDDTKEIFERVSLGDEFPDFLTLPAYDYLD
jgi:malate synthase